MDDLGISQSELERLSDREKNEIAQFAQAESQRLNIQKNIHDFSETCFKKCIRGSISGGRLTSKESTCMTNCVNRFMDTNLAIFKHLESMRASQ